MYKFERRVELAVEGIKESSEISPANKDALLEYSQFLKASGKSLGRQDKLLRTTKIMAELLGAVPFKEAAKKDLVRVVADYIRQVEARTGRKISSHTRSDFKKITKQFFAWLYDVDDPRHEGYPKSVSWIRPRTPKSKLKSSDLLTPREVKELVQATTDLRMKALIMVCYECGLRIGELLKMKVGDVQVKEQCAQLTVSGKTGPREAFSIESLALLLQWLDSHPHRDDPEAWLWTEDTEPLSYYRARSMLLECRRKAHIKKRVYWHLFRHSSATRNADLGEPMLRKVYGWSEGSDKPSTYVHLSGKTVKKALLRKHGLKEEEPEEPRVVFCPRCNVPNQPEATICSQCKSVLGLQKAVSLTELGDRVRDLQQKYDSLMEIAMTTSRTRSDVEKLLKQQQRILEKIEREGYVLQTED